MKKTTKEMLKFEIQTWDSGKFLRILTKKYQLVIKLPRNSRPELPWFYFHKIKENGRHTKLI